MKRGWPILLLLCAPLAACGGEDVKESLGLNRKAPDEFRVVSRPPLSIPPEFNLRPPGTGHENVSGAPAQETARARVLSNGTTTPAAPAANSFLTAPTAVGAVTSTNLPTNADAQFLSNIGSTRVDPNVRSTLDQEKPGSATKDDRYLFGGKTDTDPTVDAKKEAARLKADKAQGKPPTAGDTPVFAPKDKGILGDIF